MEKTKLSKLKMICDKDFMAFETAVNDAVEELALFEPICSAVNFSESMGFWMSITYTEQRVVSDAVSVADEFHLEGIRFTCENCPLHDPITDGRKKWCPCKYSDSGVAHMNREACEYFYKELKQNRLEPIGI